MKRCAALMTITLAWAVFLGLTPVICGQKQSNDDLNWTQRFLEQQLRAERWALVLPRDNAEQVRKKLIELEAVVVIDVAAGPFRVHEDLRKNPNSFKQVNGDDFRARYIDRFYCHTEEPAWVAAIAGLVDSKVAPRSVLIGFPLAMEEAIVQQEANRHKLTEKEIDKREILTVFALERQGGGWAAQVIREGKKKDLRKLPQMNGCYAAGR